jgi:demethylmenaquinone methyltransferase/2-methoxy-6-polyprenyl-1,4-benzoquinol methylase
MENREERGLKRQTSFGFAKVAEEARQARVNEVFASVAPRYDLMNDLMSGGLHRLWKDDVIAWLAPPKGSAPYRLIDVAGGTGDLASRFLDVAGEGGAAVICDISPEMIKAGRERPFPAKRPSFVQGNAEALPFASKSFEAYTIGFGIRNVTHIERALAEAYRVLKPGGRFLCLEFSSVEMPILDRLYETYCMNVIPSLGGAVAGDRAAYRYLVESIRRFPDQKSFMRLIEKAGFQRVRYRNVTGGIAAIHSAWRL